MGLQEGVKKASIGIFIGILVPLFINTILKQFPDANTILNLFELLTLVGLIKSIDTIKYIPMPTAAGYFLTIFLVGSLFMLSWEVEFHVILLMIYLLSKLRM